VILGEEYGAVGVVARIFVGLVLIVAGTAKLRSRRWPLLALEMGTPRIIIMVLPAFETLLGLALVLQVARPIAPVIAAVLFAVFTVVVVSQYRSGSEAPCNCFGGNEEAPIGWTTILRNCLLLVVALAGVI